MPTFRNLYDGLAPLIKVAIRPGFRQTLASIAHYAPTALMIRLAKSVLDSDVSKPVVNILQQKAKWVSKFPYLEMTKINFSFAVTTWC